MERKNNLTAGEKRVLDTIREGVTTPSEMARSIGVSTSAVSQQLKRLTERGLLSRERNGKSIIYGISASETDSAAHLTDTARVSATEGDWELIRESYEALNRVWSHVLKLDLFPDELKKLREARNLLEDILHEKGRFG